MDSNFEFRATFKNKKAILNFFLYLIIRFFTLPVQLFLYNFGEQFGKSKIYKRIANVKIVELTLFSILAAIVVAFLIYWLQLILGYDANDMFYPAVAAIFVMLFAILRLFWVFSIQAMEVLVTFVISLYKTCYALFTEASFL